MSLEGCSTNDPVAPDREDNSSTFQISLTDAIDNRFIPNAGGVVQITGDRTEPLLSGLNFSTDVSYVPNGDVHLTLFADGQC